MQHVTHSIQSSFIIIMMLIFLFCISFPMAYATDVQDIKYYALLVGQSYDRTESLETMPASVYDVQCMKQFLSGMDNTPYKITAVLNQTASEIRSALVDSFHNAGPKDICLFYYSGHGAYSDDKNLRGALVGTDQEFLPLTEICQLFCQFSGIKIIILDSCYSGNIVTALRALKENGEDVSGVFALCAAGPFEQTVAVTEFSSGFEHGIFTTSLLTGSMADNKTDGSLPADRNKDNAISLMEAYFYIRSTVKNPITNQHAVMWPEGEDIILWRYDSKDDMYD